MLSLPPDVRDKLRSRIATNEGYEQFPYTDSTGNLSIGLGRNLKSKGISMEEALYLADRDIMDAERELWHYCPWYARVDDARKSVLVEMVYNEGIDAFLKFDKMISCIQNRDYEGAAKEMLNSLWAAEVKGRASRLAIIMETGSI